MNYYYTEPEVAGQLGPHTEYLSTFPTTIGMMAYQFDRWPADEFVQAHPCFAVSQRIKKKIEDAKLTGCEFSPALVGVTDYFGGNSEEIPPFFRLVPKGTPFVDDFGLSEVHQLILSQSAKNVFDGQKLNQCVLEIIIG